MLSVAVCGCVSAEGESDAAPGHGGAVARTQDAERHTLADAAPTGGMNAGGQDAGGGTGGGTGGHAGGHPGPDAARSDALAATDAAMAVVDQGPSPDAALPPTPCGADVVVIDLNAVLAGSQHFDGDLAQSPHAGFAGVCGGAAGGEFVFRYRVDHPLERLVFSTVHPETLAPAVLYVRTPDCEPMSEVACDRGTADNPGRRIELETPAPGDLFLVIDTGAREGSGQFRLSVDVEEIPACRDALDNDGDGRIDNADPGCVFADDLDENEGAAPPPACHDGQDNDGDGQTDHPSDPDCVFAGGDREAPLCPEGTNVLQVAPGQNVVALPDLQGNGGASATCDPLFGPENVLVLNLDEPSNVTVEVFENALPWPTVVSMRRECADAETELACLASRAPGRLRAEFVPAGELYIFVEEGLNLAGGPREARITVQSAITDCNDGLDNDFDGELDLADDGCEGIADDTEGAAAGPVACNDGVDNDGDGLTDWPDDLGCRARGDLHEGGCTGDPLWQPVECQITSWVWSSDRAFPDLVSAALNRVLWSGCNHDGQNPNGLCSLDGTGWVSVDTFPMQGCDASWWHIGGEYTGGCGGHDGDTVRHLALSEDECWDYR